MKKFIGLLFLSAIAFGGPAPATQNWTAKVVDTSSDNQGNKIVSLHFTSDQGGIYDIDDRIPFGAPSTQLADFTATIINDLNAQSVAFSSAPLVGQTVTPTPVIPPTPDPKGTIKTQFLSDYALLKEMETAINHKLMTAADLSYTAQLTTVTNELSANKTDLLPLIQTAP